VSSPAPESGLVRVERALDARWPDRIVPSLDRITALLDLMGEPQRAYSSIHVTGTNGKTSTVRMIDALLRAFGLRTGRYTSPHLQSVTERIALTGESLSAEAFTRAYDEVAPYADLVDAGSDQPLTYFEMITAMAFAAFADAPVDVGVIEVGLGGRWDATNVLQAPVAVVTPIDLDHSEYLGDTVAAVAADKAGIVYPGAVLVAARQPAPAAAELLRRADDVTATVVREGPDFGVRARSVAVGGQLVSLQGLHGGYQDIFLPLHGAHQAGNAACALAAVEAFLGGGQGVLDPEAVHAGFAAADSPGRLERICTAPTVLLDAAHNPAGARALAAAITEAFEFWRLVGVVAVLADKDVRGILGALEPVLSVVVVTTNSSPRALPAGELAAVAVDIFGADRVEVAGRLDDALETGIRLAEEEGDFGGSGVLVTGSVLTVGDSRRLLRAR
jgi:dihydrofolate synthase/folylpolyglutamate synthase